MKLTSTLAHIVGLVLGDGSVWKDREVRYCIELQSTDRWLVEVFSQEISQVLGRAQPYPVYTEKRKWGTTVYKARAHSKRLYTFFKCPSELGSCIKQFPASFLKGFFQAEGSTDNINHRDYDRVTFCNTNIELMGMVRESLADLGLHPTLVGPYKQQGFGNKPMYRVYLHRKKEAKAFLEMVK